MRGNRIRQLARLFDLIDRDQHFRRDLLVHLDVVLELPDDRTAQSFHFIPVIATFVDCDGAGLEEFFMVGELVNTGAGRPFNKHFHRTIRQFQQLQHG